MEYNSKEIANIEKNLKDLEQSQKKINFVFDYKNNVLSVTRKDNSFPGHTYSYDEKVSDKKIVEDALAAAYELNIKN